MYSCHYCNSKSVLISLVIGYRTNLIFGAGDIGGDSAFLLFGAHFPLSTALVRAHRWPVHGGRSLIL